MSHTKARIIEYIAPNSPGCGARVRVLCPQCMRLDAYGRRTAQPIAHEHGVGNVGSPPILGPHAGLCGPAYLTRVLYELDDVDGLCPAIITERGTW